MDERGRFINMLETWAAKFQELNPRACGPLALPVDFHSDEASGFLRAVEAGIVIVDEAGRCRLPAIHRASRKPTEPCLFGIRPNGSLYLAWREYITQVAAVATLVLDYGWPIHLVALDPRTWEFDVAGFASVGSDAPMLVAGETKKTAKELSKLLTEMLTASRLALALDQLQATDGHKKYRGLLKERARYFWAVAPGLRKAFRVSYEAGACSLAGINNLPCYAEIARQSSLS